MKTEDKEALKHLKALTEILKRAICALEKQVPKKPYKSYGMTVNGYSYYKCICNDCEYELDEYKDNFCPNCGQAIDWEDYE